MSRLDSLVSSQVYEIVKTIYNTTTSETSDSARIAVLQNTLGQLRLANIATLDAITTHFTRLIELTSADEAFVSSLGHSLAPCILRPRVESPLTMHDRQSYRLIRDLFEHKEAIFGELKRASSLSHTASGVSRPRAISTDESNRRANMEARNRAIASRSRASSPAPAGSGARGHHRRDRSSGPAETRFPVTPSSTTSPVLGRLPLRQSLEVPRPLADDPNTNTTTTTKPLPAQSPAANGTSEHAIPASSAPAPISKNIPHDADAVQSQSPTPESVQKRDSITRSSVGRFPRKAAPGAAGGHSASLSLARQSLKRDSLGAGGKPGASEDAAAAAGEDGGRRPGVTLTDRPMDD